MPYEVFSTFARCAAIHGAHSNVQKAVDCYNEIVTNIEGGIPSWKHTGKQIHVVGAVSRRGNQRALTDNEITQLTNLGLPPKAFLSEKENITTFSKIAEMFLEASRLMPVSDVNLKGMFDFETRDRHFWSTDAGMGQAVAFAQQTVFTLELSLKALLEANGKLLTVPPGIWKTHNLLELFDLLEPEVQSLLEQRWSYLRSSNNQSNRSLRDLLSVTKNQYMDWRYIPTLTSTELSLDVEAVLVAASTILNLAKDTLLSNSPVKIEATSEIFPPSSATQDKNKVPKPVMVEGVVQSVDVQPGFDPNSTVEVVIKPDFYIEPPANGKLPQSVTARFRKAQVESYFGIEGQSVRLVGWSTEAEPHLLESPSHNEPMNRGASYTLEDRTLRGTVFHLKRRDTAHQTAEFTLVLSDSTYHTKVDCQFITDEECEQLAGVQLGAEIIIQGQTTLLNGKPVSLFGPIVNLPSIQDRY